MPLDLNDDCGNHVYFLINMFLVSFSLKEIPDQLLENKQFPLTLQL